MPKKRKGARLFFDRRKNDIRRQYPGNFNKLRPSIESLALPNQWDVISNQSDIQLYRLDVDENAVLQVRLSVTVKSDLSWKVTVNSREIPVTCRILKDLPPTIQSPEDVSWIVNLVDSASLCPGNPDSQFVSLCEKRGGSIQGDRGSGEEVAYIDNRPVVDSDGHTYSATVRRVDCDVLCVRSSCRYTRCQPCQAFRSSLRGACSRLNKGDDSNRTDSSSHTKYSVLNPSEKDARLRNMQKSRKSLNQQVRRLQHKVQELIQKNGVELQPDDASDFSKIIADVTPVVEKEFPADSPQRIFWKQQLEYNSLQDKRQIKWHPLVLRFALNLRYVSPAAYRAVRESGLIRLPSERTLVDYTHWTTPHVGVQCEFIEELKAALDTELSSQPKLVTLSMDEMKIKSGLVFNKHSGSLVGFVDLGSVNEDIEAVLGEGTKNEKKLADHAFVFMARAVFKPTLSIPIAHYFSQSLSAEKIFPLAWEVIESLEMYEIPVTSLTSDGARQNRRFYRLCQDHRKGKLPYKCTNSYHKDKELFFFCDVPHLLKTARNCFSNSFSHSKSRRMQKKGQFISWKSIESLYLTETSATTFGPRLCHKLTRDHIWLTSYTRMRVYLAAEVMSESVACCLEYLNKDGTEQTRLFIRMVDMFFDYLNVKSTLTAKTKCKLSREPYRSSHDARFKWLSGDFLGYLDEWEQEIASIPGLKKSEQQRMCLSAQTCEGMRITVKSFTELAPKLLDLPGVEYLLSEVFSQDPLERYFSKQRHRGGSNENPTAYQVPYNASTLIQQRSIYKDIRTMNIEAESTCSDKVSEPLRKKARMSNSQPLCPINV